MSDNPFRSPKPIEVAINYAPDKDSKPAPAALTIVLVLCIIISLFGLIGSCAQSLGTAANYAILKSTRPKPNDPRAKFRQQMNEVIRVATVPNMVLLGINFVVAPMMFAGALGCQTRKPWGRNLLRWSLIAASIFVILRSIYVAFIQIKMNSTLGAEFGNVPNKGGPDAQAMTSVMSGVFAAVIVFTIIWALVQLGFYLWSFFYLNKPEVKTYLGAK